MKQPYNTALYMRLSRDDEKYGDSVSIETQRTILRQFASDNNLRVVDEYVDDGWSGTNFERPDFKRMMDDVEAGKINCIVTKDEYEIIGLNQKSLINQGFRGLVLFLLTLKIADKAIHRRQYEQNEYLSAKRGAASLCSARTCHTLPTRISDRRSTELSVGVDLYRRTLRNSTHVPLARAA